MTEQVNWPADSIERWPIDNLIPHARNARTHSDAQVAQIAASMREWGWTNPVLIDDAGGILAGHGRVLAARKLGITEIPVMVATGWTEAQKRAYILADNQLAANAGWDNDLLRVEVQDLNSDGFNLDLIGFDSDALDNLLAPAGAMGLTDPDSAPPIEEKAVSRLGDVWLLGRHRLICGDCTDAGVVDLALNGVKPHLMVTDPPYGVEYNADWRNKALRSDGRAIGAVINDDRADWREAWALFPGDVAYVWHADTQAGKVIESLACVGFPIRAQIVWVKTRFAIGRGDYHHQHEPCFYSVKDGGDENWNFVPEHEVAEYVVKKGKVGHYVGGRKQSTVWFIEHLKSDTGHSTQKPVECMKRPIENNSSPGQAVYEPFSGSGTTIIAAEMTGRSCHAIELNPLYVDMAVKRWQEFTGQTAVLEGCNRDFQSIKGQRCEAT